MLSLFTTFDIRENTTPAMVQLIKANLLHIYFTLKYFGHLEVILFFILRSNTICFLRTGASLMNAGSISNFATGFQKFLFSQVQTFSNVFKLGAASREDRLVSFYTLIITCQGHISNVKLPRMTFQLKH